MLKVIRKPACPFKYFILLCFVHREREMRIAARNEALQTATEQLQLKIQQKVKQAAILLSQIRCEVFVNRGRFTCVWKLRDRSVCFWRGGERFLMDRFKCKKAFIATKLRHWWFSVIWRFVITTALRKTVSFVLQFPASWNDQTTWASVGTCEGKGKWDINLRNSKYLNHIAV